MVDRTWLRRLPALAALTLGLSAAMTASGHSALADTTTTGTTTTGQAPTWQQATGWDKGQNKDGSPTVSCPSSNFCAATEPSDGYVTMFNGKNWTPGQQLRTANGKVPKLDSMACASARFCLATGALGKDPWGNARDSVYATFNGHRWSHAVKLGSGTLSVGGGSCVSDKLCFLVAGKFGGKGKNWGAIVTFNGKRWGTSIKKTGAEYSALSCANAHFCAVANLQGGVQTFDGKRWSKPVKSINGQASISCPQQGFCLLVRDGGQSYTFDGHSWHRTEPMPNPASGNDYATPVSDVSCSSSHFCLADGATQPDSTGFTWTIGFNGHGWAPPARLENNEPGGDSVSCPSAYFCVAAGKEGLWTSTDQYNFPFGGAK